MRAGVTGPGRHHAPAAMTIATGMKRARDGSAFLSPVKQT